MAKDDENWKRRREREEEREQEEQETLNKGTAAKKGQISSDKLDELIQKADPMIDQLNNLYNLFMSGAEKIPPIERRSMLDQLMVTIQNINKPTPAAQFKANSLNSRYIANRDRWDKMMRDLENGKIKKTLGPGKR